MSGFSSSPTPENIYNLLPLPLPNIPKSKLYRSIHDPLQPVTNSSLNKNATNIGKLKNDKDPNNYLKRNARKSDQENVVPQAYIRPHTTSGKKQAIPSRTDIPVMNLHTSKNFITANAVDVILRVPTLPRSGDVSFLKKEDYGKVPVYLGMVKEEISNENALIDDFVKMQLAEHLLPPELVTPLPEETRQILISKLKAKWSEINKRYQILCMHTIFEGEQKKRKELLEGELNGVEADLEVLERKGDVVITR